MDGLNTCKVYPLFKQIEKRKSVMKNIHHVCQSHPKKKENEKKKFCHLELKKVWVNIVGAC